MSVLSPHYTGFLGFLLDFQTGHESFYRILKLVNIRGTDNFSIIICIGWLGLVIDLWCGRQYNFDCIEHFDQESQAKQNQNSQ